MKEWFAKKFAKIIDAGWSFENNWLSKIWRRE
jgi:hypothetical protein